MNDEPSSAVEIVACCARETRAEALMISLVEGMVAHHGWRNVEVHSPGVDVFEFLDGLALALISCGPEKP